MAAARACSSAAERYHLLIAVELLDELRVKFTAQLLAQDRIHPDGPRHRDQDHAEDEPEGQAESQASRRFWGAEAVASASHGLDHGLLPGSSSLPRR